MPLSSAPGSLQIDTAHCEQGSWNLKAYYSVDVQPISLFNPFFFYSVVINDSFITTE